MRRLLLEIHLSIWTFSKFLLPYLVQNEMTWPVPWMQWGKQEISWETLSAVYRCHTHTNTHTWIKCQYTKLGGAKHPLKSYSYLNCMYREVSLTSMVAKILDILLLEHWVLAFLEAGLPHDNQIRYRREVSCADVISKSRDDHEIRESWQLCFHVCI